MGVTLFALLAFGVLTAGSASAATFLLAEWLVGSAAVTTELASTTTGELLLEDTALKADVLCSGIFDGWVGPNSLDYISEVLSLPGVASGVPLTGQSIACTAQSGCQASPAPVVWPVNLPWETEVELMEEESKTFFVDLLTSATGTKTVGYELECTILGVKSSDECTTATAASELTLEGTSLLGNFTDAFTELAGLKLGVCTFAGGETGIVEGGGTFALTGGGELTASSEGVIS